MNNLKCFKVPEKDEYSFITSMTNKKSFRIVEIDGNIYPRKCFCVKIYCFPVMRCGILHSNRGLRHCVSAKRICTSFLMHRHNFSTTCFAIFNRTGTTEGMWDFFLLSLQKALGVRANAAFRFVSRNKYMRRALKL